MCGIAGIVHRDGRPVDREALSRMTEALRHRGPDDGQLLVDRFAGFGFRRLSILDLERGQQPMQSEDGRIWSMVNGEIYNAPDLRRHLERAGHRLESTSDAAVVPHLFEEYGIGFLGRLRGMFALAVYDRRGETLFLARDPFGIKPLYYVAQGSTFAFASEIGALLAGGAVEAEVDFQAVWDYFTLQYVPEEESLFAGVSKLAPGHYLRLQGRYQTVVPYWKPEFAPLPPRARTLAEAEDRLAWVLRESVRVHLQSDVPVGAYLSGGLDSSGIVGLMRELGPAPRTFSIGFRGQPTEREEQRDAAAFARALGVEHDEVVVGPEEYAASLPAIVRRQEEPLGDPSAPALFFLAERAKAHVRVVLSGEGADELFAGYPIYGEPEGLRLFRHLPPSLLPHLRRLARHLPEGLPGKGFLTRGTTPLALRYLGNAYVFTEEAKAAFLRAVGGMPLPADRIAARLYAEAAHLPDLVAMQLVDVRTWLPGDILMKADKMAMAHSIELRVPFLDLEVFEEARRAPVAYRYRKGVTKFLLRRALARTLPPSIRTRPKLGFPVPASRWLRAGLAEFLGDTLATVRPDFLDTAYLETLWHQHRDGRADHGRKLWTVLTFLLWYDAFRPRPPRRLHIEERLVHAPPPT